MVTHLGGVGNTPVEDLRTQETDNISEGESQDEDIMRQVLTKTANIKQFVEEKYNEPREWDEIKDSLHLKISNVDIHTSISWFMDIQQTDKESLATYAHRFKWEANRCKFDNDASTIRSFLKGLKNAHHSN